MALYPYTQPFYQRQAPQPLATVNAVSRMPDSGGLFTSATSAPGFPSGSTAPTGISQSTSIGFGASAFSQRQPDLSYANPSRLQQLDISDLTYSLPAGGYLTSAEANNANSPYVKFGGSDPAANQRAQAYYSYLGTLPTRPLGTQALQNLYAQSGFRPQPGPSINSLISSPWQGPFDITRSDLTNYGAYGGNVGGLGYWYGG